MAGKDIYRFILSGTGSELLQGFGHMIDNGEGCVSVDTEYRQDATGRRGAVLHGSPTEDDAERIGLCPVRV